ncbi:MAG: dual specificity protein phosphatase family protein [Candidatus Omnitrophota bacterium]
MGIRKAFLFVFLFIITGCVYFSYLKDPFIDIPAFSQVNEQLYRGSYPKAQAYSKLKELGIKTIINLSCDNDKRLEYEQQMVSQYGFNFIQIPLSIYTWPEDEKVLTFIKTVLYPDNQAVFVHCTNGRDLTGTMIAVYRVVVEGKGPKEAYKEALRHGFWPYRGEVVLKKYIHQLKDRKVLFDFVKTYNGR